MIERNGDLWQAYESGEWIIVPTNGMTRRNGEAVMGAGVALAAAKRIPRLPRLLGAQLRASGNHAYAWPAYRFITAPSKHYPFEPASLTLIERTAQETAHWVAHYQVATIFSIQVGCGVGAQRWAVVAPILHRLWDTRFVVLTRAGILSTSVPEHVS